jgi:RNA methyltransferase, TrmH family
MITIASVQDAHIKKLRLLKHQEGPLALSHFLVEGQHLIDHALKAGVLESVYTFDKAIHLPETVKQFHCPAHVIAAISHQKTPQGIVGLCRKIKPHHPLGNHLVYLDGINDPGNVGTILRTAYGLGISTVIFSSKTAKRYHHKVIASSQGAIFDLNLFEDQEDASLLKQYRQEGYHVVMTTLSPLAKPLDHYPFQQRNILVLGNESHGIREEVLALGDGQVMIPMQHIDSLNVAVAFAIIAYHCVQLSK